MEVNYIRFFLCANVPVVCMIYYFVFKKINLNFLNYKILIYHISFKMICLVQSSVACYILKFSIVYLYINLTENRRANQEWTIQRHWQYWIHKTRNKDKKRKKEKTHNTENWNDEQHGPDQSPGGGGKPRYSRRVSSSCLLSDTRQCCSYKTSVILQTTVCYKRLQRNKMFVFVFLFTLLFYVKT